MLVWKCLAAILCSFCFAAARADETPPWALQAGVEWVQFDYLENLAPPNRSHEAGNLPFLRAAARWNFAPYWRADFIGRATYRAVTAFDGTTLNGQVDVAATDVHSMVDFEARINRLIRDDFRVFTGLSLRRWDRFLSYGSGYREVYSWTTLTFGAAGRLWQSGAFSLEAEVAARPILTGKVQAIFSQTVTSGEDTTLTLGTSTGWRWALPASWDFRSGWHGDASIWQEFTQFGASELEFNGTPGLGQYIQEPSSRTRETGLTLSVRRDF